MFILRMLAVVLPLALFMAIAAPAVRADAQTTDRARKFIKNYDEKIRPLEVAAGLAWWEANISGKDEDFNKKIEAQNKIDAALADAAAFKEVKSLKENSEDIDDPVLARAIDVLHRTYLEKQVDPELLKKMV